MLHFHIVSRTESGRESSKCSVENRQFRLIRNVLASDPTRTTGIRLQFIREVRRRFSKLEEDIREFMVEKDALGLKERTPFTLNIQERQFEFTTDTTKLNAFNSWFANQVRDRVFSVPAGSTPSGQPWTAQYVESAYRRGMLNAYLSSHESRLADELGVGSQSQEQFLRDSFGAPERMSKVQLLATRSYEALRGVTAQMSSDMSRILSQGMIDGLGPVVIARQMTDRVSSMPLARAETIARTEVIHAHAEGQLDAFKDLGVEELGIKAEWSTAGDDRVCPDCQSMEGEVFNVDEAHGLIPLHPNCRCAWIPYDESVQGPKGFKEGEAIQASPIGDVEGHSMVSVLRTAGAEGMDFASTKEMLNKAGFFPSDSTIRVQLRAGKLGKGATVPPDVLQRLRQGLIVGPERVVPPTPTPIPPISDPVPPQPTPTPTPTPPGPSPDLPSVTSLIRTAGSKGMNFQQTQSMLNAAGFYPSPATIRTQLRVGKLGQGSLVSDELFGRLQRGELRGPGTVSPVPQPQPQGVAPQPQPEPEKQVPLWQADGKEFKSRMEEVLSGKNNPHLRELIAAEKASRDLYNRAGIDQPFGALSSAVLAHTRAQVALEKEQNSAVLNFLKESRPGARYTERVFAPQSSSNLLNSDQAKEMEAFLKDIVHKDRLAAVPPPRFVDTSGRAGYSGRDNTVFIDLDHRAGVFVHEYTHAIQWHDKRFMARERDFLISRAGGMENLNIVTGKQISQSDAGAFFVKEAVSAFRHGGGDTYAARVYNVTGTTYQGDLRWELGEASTMGLERLMDEPANFWEKDPEYFRFIVQSAQNPSVITDED